MSEPVILIPGLLCDARLFEHQSLHLSQSRPVMLAQPKGNSVEDMSASLLAQAPARFALVGAGMGGHVALDVLRRAPDRVSRIALISTDPLSEPPAVAAAREARMIAACAGRLWEALATEYPPGDMGARAPDVQARLRDMGSFLGEGVYLRHSKAMQRRPDQQKTLRKSSLPALIIGGAQDTVVSPRRHEFVLGLMPTARMRIIEGVGNLVTLEAPDEVTGALETFLDGPLMLR